MPRSVAAKTPLIAPAPLLNRRPSLLREIDWLGSLPFFFVHSVALAGLWFFELSWQGFAIALSSYILRMFFVTAGYHRYFSHRSYKTSRVFQFILAWGASTTLQKGVLWWAANHRHHHKTSDQPDDLHSPKQSGILWAHFGWILSPRYTQTCWEALPDFATQPELRWLNRFYLIPALLYGLAWGMAFGLEGVYFGFFVATVLLWHGTFTINSLSHVFGSRRYQTTDTSRNNPLLALITMGEGWHNNHHTYMSSTRQGFFWYEFDLTYLLLRGLQMLGLVWDLREPPLALLENRRIQRR